MFRKKIVQLLKKHVKADVGKLLEEPPSPELGDYAFPCFTLAKDLKKPPVKIAEELAKKLKPNKYIIKIQNVGPYVNFFLKRSIQAEGVIKRILKEKDYYGSNNTGKNKRALIEHTSINPNASPHMGRARNAIIGDSIARLLKFEGYKIETHYFVNDVGKQIAMLVLGCKGKKPTFKELLEIYVSVNKKLKGNPELERDIFKLLYKLEAGDKKSKNSFEKVVDICIKGQSKILNDLNIFYDYYDHESKYLWDNSTKRIIKELEKTGKVFVDENNRKVLDLEGYDVPMKSPVLVLTRNDGTSLYVVRDIAYTMEKMKRSHDINLIVLGEDHKLYFQQLNIALDLLGGEYPKEIYYSYILLKGKGKMSTRKGTLVLLEDLMEDAVKKAEKEIVKRHGKVKDLKKRAKTIAYGAIKYSILKVSADKNVYFDIDEALSFEGDSGPYIQYAYARANSILKKAKAFPKAVDYSLLQKIEENNLIVHLSKFPEVISKVLSSYHPHIIAHYAETLARLFNEFYHSCPILSEEKDLRNTRLYVVKATKQVLRNSLLLLGIEAPDSM